MKYCLTFPEGIARQVEEAWNENGVEHDCISAGLGTVEYEFSTEGSRNDAIKLLKETIKVGIYNTDDEGEIVSAEVITFS